jgi:hypothetical protein
VLLDEGGAGKLYLKIAAPISDKLLSVPVGVRVRLLKWAVIGFLVMLAVGGALLGPAIVTDLTSRTGTFATTSRKLERLKNILYWRSPEQRRLLKAYEAPPKPSAPARTYFVPRH